MTDLIRLAERVEALAGPDREVDGLVACAIFKTIKTDDDLVYLSPICKSDECAPGTYWLVQRSGRSLQTAPSYTASLDAAMTLVSDDDTWDLTRLRTERSPMRSFGHGKMFRAEVGSQSSVSATPALALTAASLRSLAAQRGQG